GFSSHSARSAQTHLSSVLCLLSSVMACGAPRRMMDEKPSARFFVPLGAKRPNSSVFCSLFSVLCPLSSGTVFWNCPLLSSEAA
ncbi:MAG: hypothetical protein LBD06_01465, partial [Candidatus Accumulibacter sp.]|nr:hypothetical protein [Accumulibacter sp.]